MDQTVINILGGGAMAVTGWFMRMLWEADKELRADLSRLREELPKTYAEKVELARLFERIYEKLDRIEEKLDGKMDK